MPHVRDGELHAYLDGALDRLGPEVADRVREHLAGCTDCQAKVDEERSIREEASALLERSFPAEIVAPPFEELRRRAAVGSDDAPAGGSDEPDRPKVPLAWGSSSFPTAKWAWAASLVLALGTGWMMGGGSLDFRDFPQAPGLASDAASVEASFESADAPAAEGNVSADRNADLRAQTEETALADEAPAPTGLGVERDRVGEVRAEAAAPRQDAQRMQQAPEQSESQDPPVLARRTNEAPGRPSVGEREQESPPAAPPPAAVELDRLAEAEESFRDEAEDADASAATGGVAGDGGPVILPDLPVVAWLRTPDDGQIAVLQQLPAGDSVLIMWAGDAAAENELTRLSEAGTAGALGRSDAVASSSQLAAPRERLASEVRDVQVRQKAAAAEEGVGLLQSTVTAPRISLGRTELWPAVVQVRRGSGLLTVYGTSSQERLREVLQASGLAN